MAAATAAESAVGQVRKTLSVCCVRFTYIAAFVFSGLGSSMRGPLPQVEYTSTVYRSRCQVRLLRFAETFVKEAQKMSDKLRVGFIGAGGISRLHALGYETNPYASLEAVADINEDTARSRAEDYGAAKWCTDYRDLLGDPSIDAVEILLPHDLHLPVTLEALAAGKHVSLQKPVTRTLEEADRIVEAVARSPVVFRVFENFRSYQPYIRIREMIDADEIGELVSMRYRVNRGIGVGGVEVTPESRVWRFDERIGGGPPPILDHGYHVASMVEYYFGPVSRTHAMTRAGGESPDLGASYFITWESASGGFGTWENVYSPEMLVPTSFFAEDEWMEITGTRGILWSTRCSGRMLDEAPVLLYRDGKVRRFDDMETDWGHSFRDGAHEFAKAALEGRQIDLDSESARRVLGFCLAAIESLRRRAEVVVGG